MIIRDLSELIIIDEIPNNSRASEIFFLSRLLGNEMLSLSEEWPGRIYTSMFIYDVLIKKKPTIHPKCLRILTPNVALKLKSKNKVLWVTMFESEEIQNSVVFYFDDTFKSYLYMGAFNDISSLYKNEVFNRCIEKGMDCVYIDTTLCKSNPYICTEETINEIKNISLKYSNSKLALVIPNFGYEKLLVELVQAFPENVYPTKTQRYMLKKLGYNGFLSNELKTSRIIVQLPGILSELLETDIVTIYITVGNAATANNDYGVYTRQWSPLPTLIDVQALLEKIRPKQIIPIRQDALDECLDLPFHFKFLTKQTSFKEEHTETDESSCESSFENYSFESIWTKCSVVTGNANSSTAASIPYTELFHVDENRSKKASPEMPAQQAKNRKQSEPDRVKTESNVQLTNQCINLTRNRTRVIRERPDFFFIDSDDDK